MSVFIRIGACPAHELLNGIRYVLATGFRINDYGIAVLIFIGCILINSGVSVISCCFSSRDPRTPGSVENWVPSHQQWRDNVLHARMGVSKCAVILYKALVPVT